MVRLKLIVKDKPSPPAPPPVMQPARVTKPSPPAHSASRPKGQTLQPYRRLTIKDLLSSPPPPPPPPAVKPPRFTTLADIDMTADTAALDVLAYVCEMARRNPVGEEEAVRQRQMPEWKRTGRRDPEETEDDVEMMEESIIQDFVVQAASSEEDGRGRIPSPPCRQRGVVDDGKWDEPSGPTFSFPGPKPEGKPTDAEAKPGGSGRARPRHLRENPKPSRQVIEQ